MSRFKAGVLAVVVLVVALLACAGVAQASVIERVSVASGGTELYQETFRPSLSGDGRYVAFEGGFSVFVHDRGTVVTECVSVSSGGAFGNRWSGFASISSDGRYVAFESDASNLVTGDTNGRRDVFVHDRETGVTERVSVSSAEAQANLDSGNVSISADGRYVAFSSEASNLVGGDTNGRGDVFVRDRVAGTTERVSVSSAEVQATGGNSSGGGDRAISADGRYVAFSSEASNLVGGDTNGRGDIFVRDRVAGTTERVSVSSAEGQANSYSEQPSMSADGRYVAFMSLASNLVSGDTNNTDDIFIRDRVTGTTARVSVSSGGIQGDGDSIGPSISADGNLVAFDSYSHNLVAGDVNASCDVFVHDRRTGATLIASLSASGGPVYGFSTFASISGDGQQVGFGSSGSMIVPADNNQVQDIFVRSGMWAANITGLSPNRGSTAGDTAVVITGECLAGATGVLFGGIPSVDYSVDSLTQITALAPAQGIGSVGVQVTSEFYGTTPDTPADVFSYYEPPTITAIDTASGPVTGGTVVTITGTLFSSVTGPGGVKFGGKNALSYTVDSGTQITATAPFHNAGTVQVGVIADGVSTADTAADDYNFEAPPTSPLKAHERVSLDSHEAQGVGDSGLPSISGDGRYEAFMSDASNLVLGDTNGVMDVFVRDRATGTTERVSVASDGTQGDFGSAFPSISADGRYVAFLSGAHNLVSGDTNNKTDVFVYDRQTGDTERVSVATSGNQGDDDCAQLCLSADGRYVAFSSAASGLASGDYNGHVDIFVHDRQTHVTELVSRGSTQDPANGDSDFVSISADGRYVAFDSLASNLVTGDTNKIWDVFVRDRQLGTTQRVSVAGASTQGNDGSGNPHISANGRCVAFESYATNLVTGDLNNMGDVFVRDRTAGTTSRVSVSSGGAQGNDDSGFASISADGRYVAFESYATNLVFGDTNGMCDVFVRDRTDGTTRRASVNAAGAQANGDSYWSSISANGKYVAFGSAANNLVSDDTNGAWDAFAVLTPASIVTYNSYRGNDRYDTAIRLSKAICPAALPAGSGVVLAPGETFPEALCGAPLAAAYGGPVLLTPSAGLRNEVRTEILRLAPSTVFCIGFSTTVITAIRAALPGLTVIPINGTTVYDMSYRVAKALQQKVGDLTGATAIITIGTNFPDALGVSPLACAKLWPILLTEPITKLVPEPKLNPKAGQALSELGITQVIKVGTYVTTPANIKYYNLSGADRYFTNANVAKWAQSYAGLTYTHTGIATGDKFPDALAAGPFLAKDRGLLLLSPLNGPVPPPIVALLTANGPAVKRFSYVAMIEPVIGQVKGLLP